MDVSCPKCGGVNPARAKFCLECGTPLSAEAPVAASRESRRTVTVVFADLVGFTTLGERLDQESLRRVMDRFYAEMRQAIEGQDGTLAKFIGDAVLAVWGTPEVREDDALRAVRAAEAMRRSLAGLNEDLDQRWAVRVGMRTGVNTGEVVVDPARPADLLVGDTLNVAARLEQAARDGEVLIGPETQRLVRDATVLESVEPLELKGKAEPMPAWRLIDGTRPDRRAAPRLEAPLIGREHELRRLREHFDATVAARECRLVTVIGSPGLGKTRLVTEFVRSLRGAAALLEGRCEASGEGITFQPVAEVVRMAAGIDEDDPPDTARAKLGAALPESEADRERIADRVAALLGLAPPTSTEETFWAVRRLLEAVGRERPVVLVHEDIHWGQPTFLDLLEHLTEWVRDVPLLIVALARPELRETRPRLAEAGSGVAADALALEPLDADASRALVGRLLGQAELPPELAQRVLETTDGNPLFLGEMLRMLADDGVLRREGDTWVATGQAGGVAVPPTIHALLAARIERLGEQERCVVERASVIGHQFYRGAVAELMPAPEAIDGALTTLQRKDLVRPEDALWLDERVFRFHHVLIRDAAYRSLLKEARADLHERFADWLERKLGDTAGELEEVVAFHLEQAHLYRLELGPLDARGRALAARAAARLHSAGRRALAREDLPAATNLLRRALAGLPREERADVLIDLAEALLSAGDTVGAGGVVEELGLSADEAGDERLGAWATALAGQLDNLTGSEHVRDTVEAATEAAAILARDGDRAGEAKAHQVVAQAEGLLGQVAAAEGALDRALVAARAAGDRRRVTAVLSGSPRAALWGPAPIVRASGRCLDVVRILRMTPGTRHVEAAALRCQAVLEAMRGRPDAARAIIEGCRATFEELGLAFELHETAVHAGMVELLAGDSQAAEAQLRAARDGFLALHVEGGAAQAAALLARALLEQGRDEEALDETRFAEERGGEDLKTTIAWLGARAEALARGGASADALALAERAVAMGEPTDALADKADALMALASVCGAAGDAGRAREAAARARELYAQKDHAVGAERSAALAGGGEDVAAGGGPPSPSADELVHERELETTAAGRAALEYVRVFNARAWDEFDRLFVDDFVQLDHRNIGWEVHDKESMVSVNRSWIEFAPDLRMAATRVDAIAEHVVACVLTGSATVDATEIEVPLGAVIEERDGCAVRAELFDPDDTDAIRARYEELTASDAPAPEAEPATVDVWRRWAAAVNAFDWDAAPAFYDPDYLQIDRRNLGWEELRGGESVIATLRAFQEAAPGVQLHLERVLAASDDALALILCGEGQSADGGRFEIRLGHVELLVDGRFVYIEQFEADDEVLRARFEELRAPGVRPVHPYVRAIAEYNERAFNDRRWDDFRESVADDGVVRDLRLVADTESRGPDAMVDLFKVAVDVTPGLRMRTRLLAGEVLSGGMRMSAAVTSYYVPDDEPGAPPRSEVTLGNVNVARGRRVTVTNALEDDPQQVLAHYDALRLGLELERTPVGRLHAAFVRAFDARDWDALRALFHDDYVQINHQHVSWDAETPEALVEMLREWTELAPDARFFTELLAQSEHCLAAVSGGRASVDGAPVEVAIGVVLEERDGRIARREAFEPEARDAILACFERVRIECFERLRSAGGGGAPPLASDFLQVDRRGGGWTEAREPVPERSGRSLAESDDAYALIAGEVGQIGLLVDGELSYLELHDADEGALLERYEQLVAPGIRPVQPVTRAMTERVAQHFNARDWDPYRALLSDDFRGGDLRLHASTEIATPDEAITLFKQLVDVMPGVRMTHGLLAGAALPGGVRVTATITTYTDPGNAEVTTGSAGVTRDGKLCRTYVLEPDVDAVLAHYDSLRGELEREHRLRQTTAGRSYLEYMRAFNERDWEAFAARFHDEYEFVDHRQVGWDARGAADLQRTMQGWARMSPDSHLASLRVLAQEEHLLAAVMAGTGTVDGSTFEVALGSVSMERDGLTWRTEIFDPGDDDAILARFEELREVAAGAAPDWHALHETHTRTHPMLYDPATLDATLAQQYAPDVQIVDQRAVSPMGTLDLAALRTQFHSLGSMVRDCETALEIVAIDGPWRLANGWVTGIVEEQGDVPLEYRLWYVTEIDERGRVVNGHLFDDEAAARATWASVRPSAGSAPPPAERTPR